MDMFENSKNSKSYKILMSFLGLLFLVSMIVALVPSWREKFQDFFWPQDRLILAKTQGQLSSEGPLILVFKVKTKEGLFIEIFKYQPEDKANLVLMAKFPLEGKQDGFFNFQNQATNLAMTDVDGDGASDVVAPTFDENHQARMNVFRYDSATQSFQKMEP